jgi:uncharacterized membrane protein YphA (DoxX/SURF4 family)
MRAKDIVYWIATALVALAFISGGVTWLMHLPEQVAGVTHLGYPLYFMNIVGVWKVLGGLAIVAPRMPRIKEWAYAGILFDLTGASASHAFSHDPAWKVAVPLVMTFILFFSWALRPDSRRL